MDSRWRYVLFTQACLSVPGKQNLMQGSSGDIIPVKERFVAVGLEHSGLYAAPWCLGPNNRKKTIGLHLRVINQELKGELMYRHRTEHAIKTKLLYYARNNVMINDVDTLLSCVFVSADTWPLRSLMTP